MQRDPSVLACVCGLFVVAVCCITYVAFYNARSSYTDGCKSQRYWGQYFI